MINVHTARFLTGASNDRAGRCLTTATWRWRKNFSQWECSFHWKLRSHRLEFLRQRQIAVVRQGPGHYIDEVDALLPPALPLGLLIVGNIMLQWPVLQRHPVIAWGNVNPFRKYDPSHNNVGDTFDSQNLWLVSNPCETVKKLKIDSGLKSIIQITGLFSASDTYLVESVWRNSNCSFSVEVYLDTGMT